MKRTSKKEILAPWTVSRTCETRFTINQKMGLLTCGYTPLTSNEAFEALVKFALLHNLGSQFPIALMIAITLLTHQHYGSTVQLLSPRTTGRKQPTTPINNIPSMWSSLNEELPYYMTLSCNPEVVLSALCGPLWELEVPCNIVSPWLHTPFNKILKGRGIEMDRDHEILALIGGIRRPNIGALWMGAVAGWLAQKIIQKIIKGQPPVDALAFFWTGCLRSFMDTVGSGPSTHGNPE